MEALELSLEPSDYQTMANPNFPAAAPRCLVEGVLHRELAEVLQTSRAELRGIGVSSQSPFTSPPTWHTHRH